MRLRKEQTEAFRQRALADFEDRGLRHLRRDLGGPAAPFGDADLRRRIREGIARAGRYGLTSEQQVMCFVDVSVLLGEHFDTDAEQAWAAEVLRSTQLLPADKANVLLATACSIYREKHPGA